MDTAFERSFLFKIKFAKPGLAMKKKIWQSKAGVAGKPIFRRTRKVQPAWGKLKARSILNEQRGKIHSIYFYSRLRLDSLPGGKEDV